MQTAYVIGNAYSFFPADTVHLIIVDPGVGSNRKPLLVKSENFCFIAPDNGVLSVIYKKEKMLDIYELDPEKFISQKVSLTFHGRDIFGPAAAFFSLNQDPTLLGHETGSCIKIDIPLPRRIEPNRFLGEVIYIDRFGNLMSNFSDQFINQNIGNRPIKIKIGSHLITGLKSHYSEAHTNEISALINSWDNIEIFLPSANAAEFLNARVGDVIELGIED